MGRLTGCCCCFDLRDGSRAIGITLLVLGSLGLVSGIIRATTHSEQDSVGGGNGGAAAIASSLLHIVFNALLVRGVEKKSRGLIQAWLIFAGIINGLQSISVVVGFVFACMSGIWWIILLMLAVSGLVGLFWYWFVVVLHYFKEMREEEGFVYGNQENEGEKHAL